jgi:hypothetical protein
MGRECSMRGETVNEYKIFVGKLKREGTTRKAMT